MGQQPLQTSPRRKTNNFIKTKDIAFFERNPRLIEQILFIPELFAGPIDAQIKRVQRLIEAMPTHQLQSHIVDGLNQRFLNNKKIQTEPKVLATLIKGQQKMKLNGQGKDHISQLNEDEPVYYYELESQARFIQLIKKLQHWFFIQEELKNGLKLGIGNKKTTVRKKVLPNYESVLNTLLFSKLFLRYYLIILKKNFGSKDKQKKTLVQDFHNSIGKMICQMIQHNHLAQKKLTTLTYNIFYLQKTNSKSKLKSILSEIKQQFRPIYLTKEHSLTMKLSQYDRIRQISRCYLDQLYLRSLKEAEDPDIIMDGDEGFGVVKNFPIARVREDKNR